MVFINYEFFTFRIFLSYFSCPGCHSIFPRPVLILHPLQIWKETATKVSFLPASIPDAFSHLFFDWLCLWGGLSCVWYHLAGTAKFFWPFWVYRACSYYMHCCCCRRCYYWLVFLTVSCWSNSTGHWGSCCWDCTFQGTVGPTAPVLVQLLVHSLLLCAPCHLFFFTDTLRIALPNRTEPLQRGEEGNADMHFSMLHFLLPQDYSNSNNS